MSDFELEPQGNAPATPPQDDLEALKAKLKEQEARAAELDKAYRESQQHAARLTDYVASQLQQQAAPPPTQATSTTNKPTPPATSEAPDRDEDPDAYIEWVINQRVQEAINSNVAPLKQAYEMDRKVMMGTAEATALSQIERRFTDFGSLKTEVAAYMQQLDPTLRADPSAWEHAYYIVKGQKAVAAEQAANTRAAAADDGRGRPSASGLDGLSAPPITIPKAAEKLARFEKMSQADWEDWGDVKDIDDFKRLKAKRAKAGGTR